MSLKNKLYDLLRWHDDQVAKPALTYSLGDAYLYKSNPVFKNIRDHFLTLNYSYTQEDFCHYQVLPYASLPAILKEKKVPYFDNVTVLREIEKLHPKRFTCGELIKVKSNYTLHESSHCIADHYLKNFNINNFLSSVATSADSKKAFKLIMAESFANAVESFANVYNLSSEQRLFYELNSYVTHNKKINSALQECLDILGSEVTFQLIYISYLYANCLKSPPSTNIFQQIIEPLIFNEALRKKAIDSPSVRKIFNHGFELSLDFRLQTTGFFLSYSGINTPLMKVLDLDILAILKNSIVIQDFLANAQPF